jgi:hypothetical protein
MHLKSYLEKARDLNCVAFTFYGCTKVENRLNETKAADRGHFTMNKHYP